MTTTATMKFQRPKEKSVLVEVRCPNRLVEKRTSGNVPWMKRLLHGSVEGTLSQEDPQERPYAPGHMADVYRGTLSFTGGTKFPAAIKLSKKNVAREAGLWLQLEHRNLAPLVAFVEERSLLISRFYGLGNLGKFLQDNPSIDLDRRLSLIFGIGTGLNYLHDQGIVHGDMKPSNVLIDDDETPLICDFGISQLLGSRGYTTASVGTRAYIAPELRDKFLRQQRPETGAWTTKESDMYSFGILVLEVLSSVPKTEVNPSAPRREDYVDSVPDDLWEVFEPCCAMVPQRPSQYLGGFWRPSCTGLSPLQNSDNQDK
ncbi:kinase-like domain-containing protein [Mycena rebaudengoi]|nr:kinase-like domain-containing protein [Mycena rebaudengoi]